MFILFRSEITSNTLNHSDQLWHVNSQNIRFIKKNVSLNIDTPFLSHYPLATQRIGITIGTRPFENLKHLGWISNTVFEDRLMFNTYSVQKKSI